MPPGPVQEAAVVALADDEHVERQRERYARRLRRLQQVLVACGYPVELPEGAFYLWALAPDGDAWAVARDLATRAGIVVSPGEFYGPASTDWFRVAAVQPDDRIELVAARVGA
jgi:aspartate/methionine/tyrosine aminotransferase